MFLKQHYITQIIGRVLRPLDYYANVYNLPTTEANSEVQFTVSY